MEINPVTRTDYDSSVDAQLATLVRQVTKQLSGLSCKDIGILQIVNLQGEEGNFEKYVKDELTNRLSRTYKFRVFPIDELTDDLIDSNQSILDEIIYFFKREPVYLTGTTVDLPKGIKVGIQITSIKSGQVLGTASMLFSKDRSLLTLIGKGDTIIKDTMRNSSSRISHYEDRMTGRIIKVSDNDYVELIHGTYTLYVKRINFEYSLFTDEESTVEIFLNEDYRVMSAGDMVNFSYGSHQFVLSLQRVTNHKALFTFANLNETENDDDSETTTSIDLKQMDDQPISQNLLLSGFVTPINTTDRSKLFEFPLEYRLLFIAGMSLPRRRRNSHKTLTKNLA
ncbi:hypothetical protein [Desulfuromusa kysingii]|uniref:hypothetical protein n=1 Tax=Desulfuromusa kysingii TaxID=37625 RepID=UPI0011143EAC|nr:hypothetical protein [Desulfuromusa kysingii]